jgi:hypothetical protein
MANQPLEPGPGRSTADAAFNAIKKDVAERNERAHKAAIKIRHEKDRRQALLRRQRDLH